MKTIPLILWGGPAKSDQPVDGQHPMSLLGFQPSSWTMEIAGAEDLVSATWTSGGEQGTWLRDIRLDDG